MSEITQPLKPGTVLPPGHKLRPKIDSSTMWHARQGHSGAPWHPDYRTKTEEIDGIELPFEGKSLFDSVTFFKEAIELTANANAIVQPNGNLLFIVNFGHEVGFDERAKQRTEIASVVVKQISGKVVTVFPGRPDNQRIPLPIGLS